MIVEQQGTTLRLGGELRMSDAAQLWKRIRDVSVEGDRLDIDLANVVLLDGAIMSLLVELRVKLAEKGVRAEIVGTPERLVPLVHLYAGDEEPRPPPKRVHVNFFASVGNALVRANQGAKRVVAFFGEIMASLYLLVRHPRAGNWRAIPGLAERAGIDGVPIVLLLNFLVGFVMAFQSSRQLKLYGANVFVADVVGISVTRELAPLMTAIIMSGRSGAAFAAELGTMRVSEEIDALETMGFSPAVFLILPRVIALALVAPVLTLFGDVVGVIGGIVVAATTLDVSPRGYLAELETAVLASDIWTGLLKSFAFGIAIAFIGCQQGFNTRGAAAGVGRGTTTTVVSCLFTVVIVDTLFTVLFRMFGA